MEKILSSKNMNEAYRKVKANNGAAGIDGIGFDEIEDYIRENWGDIRRRIVRRRY